MPAFKAMVHAIGSAKGARHGASALEMLTSVLTQPMTLSERRYHACYAPRRFSGSIISGWLPLSAKTPPMKQNGEECYQNCRCPKQYRTGVVENRVMPDLNGIDLAERQNAFE